MGMHQEDEKQDFEDMEALSNILTSMIQSISVGERKKLVEIIRISQGMEHFIYPTPEGLTDFLLDLLLENIEGGVLPDKRNQ